MGAFGVTGVRGACVACFRMICEGFVMCSGWWGCHTCSVVLRRVVPAAHDKVMNPWPTTCAGEVVRRVMSPLVCFASAVGRAPHHPLESGFNFPPRLRPTVLRSHCAHAVIVTTGSRYLRAVKEVAWLAAGDEDAEVRVHESTNPPPSGTTVDVKV